jgi:hypothetical protein
MAKSYNVDDILAEIDRKHQAKKLAYEKSATSAKPAVPIEEPVPLVEEPTAPIEEKKEKRSFTKKIKKLTPEQNEEIKLEKDRENFREKFESHEKEISDIETDNKEFTRFKSFKKGRIEKAKDFNVPEEEIEKLGDTEALDNSGALPNFELGKKPATEAPTLAEHVAEKAEQIEKTIAENAEKAEEIRQEKLRNPDILGGLKLNQRVLRRRAFGLFLALVAAVYLYVAGNLEILPLATILRVSGGSLFYALFSCGIMLFACIRAQGVVIGGVLSALRFSPERDTIPAFASLFCLIQTIWAVFYPGALTSPYFHLLMPVGILILLFNTFGKLSIIKLSIQSHKFIKSSEDRYSVSIIGDERRSSSFTAGLLSGVPHTVIQKKFSPSEEFIYKSFEKDALDRTSAPLFWVMLAVAAGMAVLAYFYYGILASITAFTLITCAANSLGLLFVLHIPQTNANNQIGKNGMLIGYDSFTKFKKANSVVIPARQLFKPEYIEMVGIKTFAGKRIDDAIIEAAAIVTHADSVLTGVFMNIIGGKTNMLPPSDGLIYEDGLGISAWIDDKRVLIGNREMMINHNVEITSKDYEDRYLADGNNVIYLSTGGNLSAVFVVRLKPAPDVQKSLDALAKNDVYVSVYSVDSMLTSEKISQVFDLPENMFKIIPSRFGEDYREEIATVNEDNITLVVNDDFSTYIKGITCAKRMQVPINVGLAVYLATVILGVLIAAYGIWSGNFNLGFIQTFSWMLTWFGITICVGYLR